jgi:heme exporter protein B
MMFFRKAWIIARKDILTELRSREMLSTMGAFAVLIILLFAFAFDLRTGSTGTAARASTVTPGALWVVIAFAGMLGLGRTLTSEIDRGSFDALLLTPVDRSAIFLGKAIGIIIFMFAVEAVILPLFVIFFNQPFLQPAIILIVALGTIGYGGIGTLLSTMAANTRLREVLLPVLLLPIAIPALLAAVKCTAGALDGRDFVEWANWFGLLVAFDLVMLGAAFLVYDFVVED